MTKKETTEHRQVVIAAMIAVVTTLMIMMLTAQTAHAAVEVQTLGSSNIAHCGMLPAGADTQSYTKRSRNVRIIQRKLQALGYSVGDTGVDGIYGKNTKAATASFQGDYNLNVDSKVGQMTAVVLAYMTHSSPNVRRCKDFVGMRQL